MNADHWEREFNAIAPVVPGIRHYWANQVLSLSHTHTLPPLSSPSLPLPPSRPPSLSISPVVPGILHWRVNHVCAELGSMERETNVFSYYLVMCSLTTLRTMRRGIGEQVLEIYLTLN